MRHEETIDQQIDRSVHRDIISYLRMLDKCIYLCDSSRERFCLRAIIMMELHARHTMHEQKCLTVATELLFQNERLAAQSQNYKIVEKMVVVFVA